MNLQYIKLLVSVLLYVSLLVLFCVFYLVGQLQDFFKGRTTITSRLEKAEYLEPPTLTVCFDPPFKTSVARRFGLAHHFDYQTKALPSGTDYGQRFHQLSYILNEDYNVSMSVFDFNRESKTEINEGFNDVDGLPFEVMSIQSSTSGTCLNIQPRFVIKDPFTLDLDIKSTVQDDLDQFNRLNVYLTSKNGWQGISSADWPQINPSKLEIVFKENGYTYMDSVKATEFYFENGVDDSDQCWTDEINSGSCPVKCKLVNFAGNLSRLPICQTLEEVRCILGQASEFNVFTKCNQKKKMLTFERDLIRLKRYQDHQDDESQHLRIGLFQMSKEIKEEIDVITTQGLIGSIGGYLGTVFGFSISTFVLFLIENILKRTGDETIKPIKN